MFGPAFTVAKELNDDPGYRKAADYIDEVPSGHVVAIDNLGLETCTCWGGILTAYARKKGLGGTVINGLHRDVEMIRSANYPVFSKGPFMVTGKGRTRLKQLNIPITIGGVAVSPGDILFGDDHGLVVIPQQILPGVLKRAEAVKSTEHEILRLVINEGLPLHLARERLRYNDLTMPCPSSTL
jgi:regulator of RNase E activity RraA